VPAKYVQLRGESLHFLHTGTTTLPDVPPALEPGALFVCVHGAGRNAGDFRRTLAGLAPAHSVVALDLPAHGRSTGLDALPTIAAYADVCEAFLGVTTRRPVILVGWSMGALAALELASRGAAALAGLVLIAATPVWALDETALAAVRDVVRGRRPQIFDKTLFSPATSLEVMREAWMEQVKTDPRVLYGDLLAAQRFDGRSLLSKVRLPTLVVHGADDQLMPRASAEALVAGIAGARLAVVERAGHIPQLEQPERLHELLASFAAGLA
jgi:pimeloyl-ACP methyl ester carboxylesterase